MIRKNIKIKFDDKVRFMEDQKFGFECLLSKESMIYSNEKLTRIHKMRYGFGGLSEYMFLMQKHEIYNYIFLLRKKYINLFLFLILAIKSYLAFIKRLVFCYLTKIINN